MSAPTRPAPAPAPPGRAPAWVRELDARLPVSPQAVLSGNVDDLHLVDGLPLRSTLAVVGDCLLSNGYRAVLHWEVTSGVEALAGSDPDVIRHVASPLTLRRRGDVPTAVPTQEKARALAALLHRVVYACSGTEGSRVALVVEGAHRIAPAEAPDPDVHDMFVVAGRLVRIAPRRQLPADRRPGLHNTVIWLVERESDLPHWLLGSDDVPVVSLPMPELGVRREAAALYAPSLPGFADLTDQARCTSVDRLAALTEGMQLRAVAATVGLADDRDVPADRVEDAVRLFRSGLQSSPWHDPGIRTRIRDAPALLNRAVLGQARAVRSVTDILARAALGLSGAQSAGHPSRPQGVVFFAGPTGVGKTELAKQIATVVFGREEAMVRFDMSEFSAEHSEARLIGSPPGYVGHSAGGELTNAVRQRPFSLLLFDEIEKAHPLILDKFLQILEDGRLTDGAGSTVHFTETLIVFTSNLGIYEEVDGRRRAVVEPGTPYDDMRTRVLSAIRTDFTMRIKRPELLNRIGDNIVVFDFLSDRHALELLDRYLDNVRAQVERRCGARIRYGEELRAQLRTATVAPQVLEFGGRAVGSLVESRVLNPLTRQLIDAEGGAHYDLVAGRSDDEGHHLDITRRP